MGEPLEGAIKIAVNYRNACAVLQNGQVWCWGFNENGELGDGEPSDEPSFRAQRVPDLEGITSVGSSSDAWCVVLEGGGVACWGSNLDVDFAGLDSPLLTPTIVPSAQDAVDVRLTRFLDGFKACTLDRDGAVICWRPDGITPREALICAIEVEALPSVGVALKRSGAAIAFHDDGLGGCPVLDLPELEGASALSQGTGMLGDGVCGILDGRVSCASDIDFNSGDAIELTEIDLPAGAVALDHSVGDRRCALLDNDELWCWGGTALGLLRMAEPRMELSGDIIDFAIASDGGCAVMADTTVRCWGSNQLGQRGSDALREDPPSLVLR
jgi:hypothetical protein